MDANRHQRRAGSAGGLRWSVDHSQDVVVARLHGDLDLGSAAALEAALVEIARGPCRRLVIDLRGLEFIDSNGLHAIARVRAHLTYAQELVLIRGPHAVHRTFEIVGLDRELTFVDALD